MKHVGTQPLETERLLLRRFVYGDADAMFANWATDPEVSRYLRWEPHLDVHFTRQIIRDWVKDYESDERYHWAVTRKSDGALMGSLGIMPVTDGLEAESAGSPCWEPGYCYGRAFWGQGYGSEALCAAVDWFMESTGAERLHCCHAVENPASGRVMEKAGFVYYRDGEYHKFDGTPVRAKFYKLEAADWKAAR